MNMRLIDTFRHAFVSVAGNSVATRGSFGLKSGMALGGVMLASMALTACGGGGGGGGGNHRRLRRAVALVARPRLIRSVAPSRVSAARVSCSRTTAATISLSVATAPSLSPPRSILVPRMLYRRHTTLRSNLHGRQWQWHCDSERYKRRCDLSPLPRRLSPLVAPSAG